jgi:hypothetical protein
MGLRFSLQQMLPKYISSVILRRHIKYNPVDLRSTNLTPLAGFDGLSKRSFLVNFNLRDCRILRGVAIAASQDAGNPFVNALIKFQESRDKSSISDVLRDYYHSFQPSSSTELLGLKESASPCLKLSAYSYFYPWDPIPNPNHEARRFRAIAREDATHGSKLGFQGWHHFGPVTEAKIALESRRLLDIYSSISKSGFVRNNGKDGDIEGVVLEDNNRTVLLVKKGHHRIAALAALGYESVAVRLNVHQPSLIRRSHSQQWQSVISGDYIHTEALNVFDYAFRGGAHHL